jgi:hypothetical protein
VQTIDELVAPGSSCRRVDRWMPIPRSADLINTVTQTKVQ